MFRIYIDEVNKVMFLITQNNLTKDAEELLKNKINEKVPYEVLIFGNTEFIEFI
ncbi:hypothetical protein M4L38_01005 [Staphylococcus equorum]|uniref:hypothetical protein n=1 Tax=Staphylococcus equorum TaxID=246432 RepID=UPI0024078C44|nr:hypothetical protein [Staphylococcus equorum]MDG0821344.1 hypothetical protein [Staphylococcus equorum]